MSVSVGLSAAACPHYCTDPDATWGSGRGCPPSCALLGGFAISARVALLWQHYGNAWQSPAVIHQAHRTQHACCTLHMPAKTPLASNKIDVPAACTVPFRPYCVGVVTRTWNVSKYMLVITLCLVMLVAICTLPLAACSDIRYSANKPGVRHPKCPGTTHCIISSNLTIKCSQYWHWGASVKGYQCKDAQSSPVYGKSQHQSSKMAYFSILSVTQKHFGDSWVGYWKTRRLPTHGLDISRAGQLADWTSRGYRLCGHKIMHWIISLIQYKYGSRNINKWLNNNIHTHTTVL